MNLSEDQFQKQSNNWALADLCRSDVKLLAFCIAIILPLHLSHGQSPEYLSSENPIPAKLEDTLSAVEGIAVPPETRSFRRMFQRRRLLPQIREMVPQTGLPFVDDAVYHLSPRTYYRYQDSATIGEAFAAGGEFGLQTGYLAETLRLGFAGYTSQNIYGPSDRGGTGLLAPGQEGYTVLGEANVELKLWDWGQVKLYRQQLEMPYINANDSRMTPSTFEAYGIRTSFVQDMPIGFGHIEKIRFRNRDDFESLSSHAGAEGTSRGVSILGGQYNFTDDTNIGAISQYGWDMFHTAYVEAVHFYEITDDLSLKTGIQFTDQRSVGDEILGSFDAQHLGYKLALGYQSLIIGGSVTWTSGGDGIRNPWGGSPSYNSVMISDFDRAGEVAVRGGLSYDFSGMGMDGLAASVSWLHGNTPDSGTDSSPDQQEFNINLDYRPAIEGIDNLWLRLRYAENDGDVSLGGVRRKDFRVILNYSFTF